MNKEAGAMELVRTFRFAPSPNGRLHLGHAYSALLNQQLAALCGGRLLLRIEDVDQTRARSEFVTAIRDDLDWLGIRFDGPVWMQSERAVAYEDALSVLERRGLVYRSAVSRKQIAERAEGHPDWPRDPDGALRFSRADWPSDEGPILRLDMAAAIEHLSEQGSDLGWTEHVAAPMGLRHASPTDWGDVILKTRDGMFTYHLAVVGDDAAQGVTDIVRGRDLERATDVHRVLQALLELPVPEYHHHGLITDDTGEKLAKSKDAPTLQALREQGISADEVRRDFGF